ncbi:glycosyltransferase [Undibacterium sp. Ji67W]|uniref:glycosyltransferase n=1 Tax=Undibacterium sp. Ji67W TaxID=3413042 RepID=UPI003BF1E791
MKKVTILCSRLPYPPIGGAPAKNMNLIRGLSEKFDLDIVVISETKPTQEAIEVLSRFGRLHIFHKPKWRMYLNLLFAIVYFPRPLQVSLYYFFEIESKIRKIISGSDAVLATLVRTAPYVEKFDKPVIFDLADSIGLNYRSAKSNSASKLLRLYYAIESPLLLAYERKVILSGSKSLFFSRKEMEFFQLPEKTKWIPHGVNENLFSYIDVDPVYENSICFLGKMDYQPNIDAVVWFCDCVLPLLDPKFDFYIIGTKPTQTVRDLAGDRVKITGFLEDPFKLAKSCFAMVAPMRNGGGIQNKVLEGMALGCANVVTTLAAAPIDGAVDQVHLSVADSPEEIAAAIHKLHAFPVIRTKMGIAARELVMSKYSWDASLSEYVDVINKELK